MNEKIIEILNSLMSEDKKNKQPYIDGDAIVTNSPYQNAILNQVMSNISTPHGGGMMRPSDALKFYNEDKDMAQEQMRARYLGESKTIDDIIKQSDLVEFLSKAQADKTRVETPTEISTDNMARRIGYSSDIRTPNDLVRYLTTVRPAFEVNTPENNSNVDNFFKMIESIDAVPKGRKKS
tara:strand:+ start:596 stop:1135 length:540 start_codon:yes stop_codon:yes gene_type:complete